MSDDKKGWTPVLVRQQLQSAVYLELWTIPMYLTAAYSIKAPVNEKTHRPEIVDQPDLPKNADGSYNFKKFTSAQANQYAFNSILSVAIQEMLHLELAANVLNAVRPEIDYPSQMISSTNPWVRCTGQYAPSYSQAPPSITPNLPAGVTLELGPFDENQVRLFQWIEHKDEPSIRPDPQAYSASYPSIGDFYTALSYGLAVWWPDLYPPKYCSSDAPTADELLQHDDWGESFVKAVRRGAFPNFLGLDPSIAGKLAAAEALAGAEMAGDYPFSITVYGWPVDAWSKAYTAIKAISAQGEGAGTGDEVPPVYRPTTGEKIEIFLDSMSHYERFTQLLQLVGKVETYSVQSKPGKYADFYQDALNQSYSSFLMSVESAFASTYGVGIAAMKGLGNRTLEVWTSGLQPQFQWIDPGPYVDPKRTKQYHACQGLNMCKGLGAGGTGTKPGDGNCATAYYHACGQTNICAGQGGCGYAGDPLNPSDPDNWKPNYNSCQGLGGCGAPIPYGQLFNGDSTSPPVAPGVPYGPAPAPYSCVWTYARQLMREKVKGFPKSDPAPNDLRKSLSPTTKPGKDPIPPKC
jgi:hypothetical protein